MKISETIFAVALLAILFVGFFFLNDWGWKRYEQYECYRWQQDALEFYDRGYYLADWQKAQCQHYSIEINVKQ